MQDLIDVAVGRPFIRWSAHYGLGPHVCAPAVCGYPQADWTQWAPEGAQGQNVDRSVGRSLYGNGSPMLVAITTTGTTAHCADVEPGAMSTTSFPSWYDEKAIKPRPLPSPPPQPEEEVVGVAATTDLQGHVHLFQETSDGKVYHIRQLSPDGVWDTTPVVLLDDGAVPAKVADPTPASTEEVPSPPEPAVFDDPVLTESTPDYPPPPVESVPAPVMPPPPVSEEAPIDPAVPPAA